MALGASQGNVLGMVLKQGLALAGAGVVLGLAGAAAATRLLTSFLFEVKAGDPLTYVGVAVLLRNRGCDGRPVIFRRGAPPGSIR